MSTKTNEAGAPRSADPILSTARAAGAAAMGLILGFFLLPAILELMSLVGNVTAFKYQNF